MEINKHAPCFIYSKEEIVSSCGQLKEALPEFDFLYSIKANPFEPVVRLIGDCGFGADAASLEEVNKAISCGLSPNDIYYSAPGKTKEDIRSALGKCILVADSLHELMLIEQIGSEHQCIQKIGIRIHPAFAMDGESGSSKFGVDLEQIDDLREIIDQCAHLEICGIHVHLQSQILDTSLLASYYCNVMDMALHIQRECGISLSFINFGSGIGIVYDEAKDQPVDLDALHDACVEVFDLNRKCGARLLIETGRFVTCRAGKYYTPVLDKKTSREKTYLIVAGGLNGFLRPTVAAMLKKASSGRPLPAMEPLYTGTNEFQISVLKNHIDPDSVEETVDIVGNLCTGLDIIAEDITLPKAEIGDLLAISNAGSYGMSLSPVLFASQKPPEEFLL